MKREDIPRLLWDRISMVEPYPSTVAPVSKTLTVTAFFPGGSGLWLEDESDAVPEILVLGQDFSSVDDFNQIQKGDKADLDCPTWRNLLLLLKEVGISPSICFFSNVYMGLRKEGPITGIFPGSKDSGFSDRTVKFLKEQIATIKPSLIITLGVPAALMMAQVSDDLSLWSKKKRFSYFDQLNSSIVFDARMDDLSFNCVRLLHPSFRKVNLKHRTYRGKSGHEAEVLMLLDALADTKGK